MNSMNKAIFAAKNIFYSLNKTIYSFMLMLAIASCGPRERAERIPPVSPFDDDVEFLSKYADVIVLSDTEGKSRIAVMGGLQARVMTSTAGGCAASGR